MGTYLGLRIFEVILSCVYKKSNFDLKKKRKKESGGFETHLWLPTGTIL